MLQRLLQGLRREGKKLAQVARIWARDQLYIPRQGEHDDPEAQLDEALAAVGLREEVAEVAEGDEAAPQEDKCYLWPCNVATFDIWQRLQSQWRVGGIGGERTGLDYAGVISYLREVAHVRNKDLPEVFGGLQAMELAALEVWASQRT